jgi:hypothetical protein
MASLISSCSFTFLQRNKEINISGAEGDWHRPKRGKRQPNSEKSPPFRILGHEIYLLQSLIHSSSFANATVVNQQLSYFQNVVTFVPASHVSDCIAPITVLAMGVNPVSGQ